MNRQKGSLLEPVLILVALSILLVFFILPSYGERGPSRSVLSLADKEPYGSARKDPRPFQGDSVYSKSISLSTGNATYENEPGDEYLVIENRGNSLINITGWKFTNNKGERTRYPSDTATIPQGIGYISPSGFHAPQNIILRPGDQAIITTGGPGQRAPYAITSFKENKCSGLIAEIRGYQFTPPLARSPHSGKLDYPTCIARHKDDADFYGRTWRIYLGQRWEMWANDSEIISLFDQFGRLVSAKTY